ncbi:MAG TPA: rRNA maturation RNase YbeY [Firmicutes bacterium]|nr:rRNA maturation RNase YbeY [Bacillota bacterium]
MELYINNEQNRVDIAGLDTVVRRVLETGLELLEIEDPVEVGVTFVDDAAIKELNCQYRQIDQATDVLSFAQEEGDVFEQPPGAPRLLGDIVISLERAQEQSETFNHSLAREVGYLTAHGLLHLLGYDHQNTGDKEEMRALEEQIMARLNLTRD